jgi:sulfite dehydrogenase (quinone) subunit SoeC
LHPALSIIVFTTASGLGYGLAAMLGLGFLDPAATSTKVAHVLALVLIGGGLFSSTLHLGNPQRAWRALSQWRSSWLSREGVMAIATFLPLGANAAASVFIGEHLPLVGMVGAVMAGVTVYCTAMIYASLRAIDAWHTPLTPATYLLFSGAGGALAVTFLAFLQGAQIAVPAILALILLGAGWLAKLSWRRRLLTLRSRSTPETATGLGYTGRVQPFELPHFNDNYLTREMGFVIARKHASKLFVIAVGLGGIVPVAAVLLALLLGPGAAGIALAFLGLSCHAAGMLVERWLFFAEARHAVMNYYRG